MSTIFDASDKVLKRIEPLKVPFDGSPSDLRAFLINVKGRVKAAGWQDICQYQDINDNTVNLLKDHARFTHENLEDFHNSRTNASKIDKADEFFQFLFGSLSKDFQNELINDLEIEDGPLAYKVIMD